MKTRGIGDIEMANGELHPDTNKPVLPVRKTILKKGLQRTLNTERYQTLVIHDEIQEEIEWTTLAERDKKISNWEAILIKRFKEFHDRALDELGLQHKKAYFKEDVNSAGPSTPNSVNDLDSLDSLE